MEKSRRALLYISQFTRDVIKIIDTEEDHRGIYNMVSFNHRIEEIAEEVASWTGAKIVKSDEERFAQLLGGKVPPPLDFSISGDKFSKTFWTDMIWCPNLRKVIEVTMHGIEKVQLKSTRAKGKDYE